MPTRTYVDIHILQTVPPSNLNRDDAGSPKQAVYGGVRRARVSSQAWKRAARVAFADHVPKSELAIRTKRISKLVAERLATRTGLDAEGATRIATHLLGPLKIKPGKTAAETAYLLFFGRPQIDCLVDLVADRADELARLGDEALKAAVEELPAEDQLASGHPIDVALFGRMVADIPKLNVDAATQVAHALSTHAVETEFDYFTAVDDDNENTESTGAGMIGTVEFNSATLYRFATVGMHQLLDNLGGDVEATTTALEVFLTAFTYSMPSGHQNTFGNRTVPALVSVVLRDDQPVNLVSAFEEPVPSAAGIAAESLQRLATEMTRTSELWGLAPVAVWSTYSPNPDGARDVAFRDALGAPLPFKDVVSAATESVRKRLASGGV